MSTVRRRKRAKPLSPTQIFIEIHGPTCNVACAFGTESATTEQEASKVEEGARSDRSTRRQPRADAARSHEDESGEAGRGARNHFPAGAEIRKRHQSNWREPPATD